MSYPSITIIGTLAFKSHATPDIVHNLLSLVNAHQQISRISDASWRLNNKNQLLLFTPTREIFSLLLTNTYLFITGICSIPVTHSCPLPAQLSLFLLN
ncbi:unnamed protein product [Rotaria sp. Silwood1]|nr:unnamed protein product [Rotaria sp. Silwood1]CAF3420078.1 unnamed protein product [Rotaria sp. Silwood1]CAF4913936.1 unnamed protein product [Rotaria sp. Silwood1]